MNTPKLKIELNKGKHGVELEKLAAIAKETAKFLTSLSVDLGEPEADWIAANFKNSSVCFEVQGKHEIKSDPIVWKNAMHSVMANDFSDERLNVKIRPDTRARFFEIAKALPDEDFASFGICENGDDKIIEWHRLDKNLAQKVTPLFEPKIKAHGEIQGIVHAFFKETKTPKLVMRELSSRNLIDCFFNEALYEHAVALLKDKDGVIFVEGEVSESESGEISDIYVSDFSPAPDFNVEEFERMIGAFPKSLTGEMDAAEALDEFRT